MKDVKIITLVGMPGAGKSFCVDYLASKGYPSVYFGGVVVDETKRRYGEAKPELESIVRLDLRAKEGNDAIVNRIIKKIDALYEDGTKIIVADGLYSWTEYKIFKARYGDDAIVIAITAPRAVRHSRLENRPVRPLSKTESITREYAEIETIEKGGPIANADYTVVNNSTTQDMIDQLDAILAKEL